MSPSTLAAALRVHHWVKNVLLFVPLVLSHRVFDPVLFGRAGAGFLAFSLVASSGYLVNDVLDRAADREHPRKRRRPVAEGAMTPRTALFLAGAVVILGFTLALAVLPLTFTAVLAGYATASLLYSGILKRYPVVDVLLLAGLYTVRLAAGAVAVDVPLSFWLATFAMFLFLSLAFVKRHSEIVLATGAGAEDVPSRGNVLGRGYRAADDAVLMSLGPASGYLSVLVFALYLNSEAVTELYPRPRLLWLVIPVLLYWVSRLWFRANRGELRDDPLVETASDPVSWGVFLVTVAILLGATV